MNFHVRRVLPAQIENAQIRYDETVCFVSIDLLQKSGHCRKILVGRNGVAGDIYADTVRMRVPNRLFELLSVEISGTRTHAE